MLIKGIGEQEDGKGGDPDLLAASRQAACHSHEVRLGDADVVEAIREGLGEELRAGGVVEICVYHHHIGAGMAQIPEGLPKGLSCRLPQRTSDRRDHFHPSSSKARSASSGESAFP